MTTKSLQRRTEKEAQAKKTACPKCKQRRLVLGPFSEPGRIRCMECGWKGRVKV